MGVFALTHVGHPEVMYVFFVLYKFSNTSQSISQNREVSRSINFLGVDPRESEVNEVQRNLIISHHLLLKNQ
jgi:hypothetical protein